MKKPPVILWFRRDLRLSDHPALEAALQTGQPILPLFILEENVASPLFRPLGGASLWWLHYSLKALQKQVPPLCLRRGNPELILNDIVHQTGATHVFWTRRYNPYGVETDTLIKKNLQKKEIKVTSFNGSLLNEPWTILNSSHKPFQVFTPYWKHCLKATPVLRPIGTPASIPWFIHPSENLDSWKLLPYKPDWAKGFKKWSPGEEGAKERLGEFLEYGLQNYKDKRNLPGQDGTSRLSPHLYWGEISPRQVWYAVQMQQQQHPEKSTGAYRFISEIGWREFCYGLLYHFPQLPQSPLRPEFSAFPWQGDNDHLKAWQQGKTGYPLIDAGMRQLWQMGWMHNRVRMAVASFLVKTPPYSLANRRTMVLGYARGCRSCQ